MRFSSLFLGLCLCALATGSCFAQDSDGVRVIVKFKDQKNNTALKKALGHSPLIAVKASQPMANNTYVITFNHKKLKSVNQLTTDDALNTILKELKSRPDVAYAVEDRKGYFKPLPKFTESGKQSKLTLGHDIQWDEFEKPYGVKLESEPYAQDGAWMLTKGESSPETVVAVLDTGIVDHPSLKNNLLRDDKGNVWGWNFAGNNNDLSDTTGSYHGTHVAGTIASHGTEQFDVLGMGPNLKILTLKIPNDELGMFYESNVINAMNWAVGIHVPGIPDNPHPAQVLNMSFGVDEKPGKEIDHCDEALQEAIFNVRNNGAVLIAAAGNDNRWEHFNAPAVCNGVYKVASTGPLGTRAYYSNYGPSVTLAAPGGDGRYGMKGEILSTVNVDGGYEGTGFDFYQGTSMASPHVAGLAGLIAAISSHSLQPIDIEKILYTTTHKFGDSDDVDESCLGEKPCGHGIINAEKAVYAAQKRFDELLTSPVSTNTKGVAQLFQNQNKRWKLVQKDRLPVRQHVNPHITQSEDGKILAQVGANTYALDMSPFSHCEIIGYDGVGCYK